MINKEYFSDNSPSTQDLIQLSSQAQDSIVNSSLTIPTQTQDNQNPIHFHIGIVTDSPPTQDLIQPSPQIQNPVVNSEITIPSQTRENQNPIYSDIGTVTDSPQTQDLIQPSPQNQDSVVDSSFTIPNQTQDNQNSIHSVIGTVNDSSLTQDLIQPSPQNQDLVIDSEITIPNQTDIGTVTDSSPTQSQIQPSPQNTSNSNTSVEDNSLYINSQDIIEPAREVASHPWFEKLARFGYVAKGIVYIIIGLLALQTVAGTGGKTTGSSGALETIVAQPFGRVLLSIMTVGIIGYVMWRLIQAILNPEHPRQKLDFQSIVKRIGYAGSGIAYTGLAFTSFKLIIGSGNTDNDSTEELTLIILEQPFGHWLVLLAGLIVIGIGISWIYRAYQAKFRQNFQLTQMSFRERIWVVRIGKFGIAARGFVFTIIGFFLIQAAIQLDAREAKGVGGTLTALARQPFGIWILSTVALGLIAYGVYCLLQARYRIIRST